MGPFSSQHPNGIPETKRGVRRSVAIILARATLIYGVDKSRVMLRTLISAILIGGTSAQRFALRSSLDFGGSCENSPDQTWVAVFGPRGDAALKLSEYPVYAASSSTGIAHAGPEQKRWQVNSSYTFLSFNGTCVQRSGVFGPCGSALITGTTSVSSGTVVPWVSSATYASSGLPSASGPTTLVSNTTYQGEWIEISSPQPVRISNYTLACNVPRRFPRSHVLAGSRDGGATWTNINQGISGPLPNVGATLAPFRTNSRSEFTHFRLIVTRVGQNSGGRASLNISLAMDVGSVWLEQPTVGDALAAAADPFAPPTVRTAFVQGNPRSSYGAALAAFDGRPTTQSLMVPGWSLPSPPAGSHALAVADFRYPDGATTTTVDVPESSFLFDITANQTSSQLVAGRIYRAVITTAFDAPNTQAAILFPILTTPPFSFSATDAPVSTPVCSSPLFSA